MLSPRLAALTLVVAILASACSPNVSQVSTSPGSPAPDAFTQLLDGVIADAELADASAEQVDLLRSAQTEGFVSFETYRAAIDSTLDCFSGAAIRYELYPVDSSAGFPVLTYLYEAPPEGNPLAASCIDHNSAYIERAYQQQPASAEAADAEFERALPVLAACLQREGYLATEKATRDEVHAALWEMVEDFERASTEPNFNPVACANEAGITNF